jgi:FlaA1/EpsC-like NDP-sugar epimerase
MRKEHPGLAQALLRFRRAVIIPVQLLLVVIANRLAFDLRFDSGIPQSALTAWWQMLPWLVAIRALTFIPFRLYEGFWRYTSIYDLRALLGGISVSSFLFFLLTKSSLGPAGYPISVVVTDAVLLTLFLGGIRLTRRMIAEFSHMRPGKRVLIFGAGDAGEMIVRDMRNRRCGYVPIGFIDDNPAKRGRRIHGVPVLGDRH